MLQSEGMHVDSLHMHSLAKGVRVPTKTEIDLLLIIHEMREDESKR